MRVGLLHFGHKIVPTVALAVDHYPRFDRRALRQSFINIFGYIAVAGANNSLDRCGVGSVDYVMLLEHKRRGDDHCAELVQRENGKPELIVALENDHNHIALADAL